MPSDEKIQAAWQNCIFKWFNPIRETIENKFLDMGYDKDEIKPSQWKFILSYVNKTVIAPERNLLMNKNGVAYNPVLIYVMYNLYKDISMEYGQKINALNFGCLMGISSNNLSQILSGATRQNIYNSKYAESYDIILSMNVNYIFDTYLYYNLDGKELSKLSISFSEIYKVILSDRQESIVDLMQTKGNNSVAYLSELNTFFGWSSGSRPGIIETQRTATIAEIPTLKAITTDAKTE